MAHAAELAAAAVAADEGIEDGRNEDTVSLQRHDGALRGYLNGNNDNDDDKDEGIDDEGETQIEEEQRNGDGGGGGGDADDNGD